jgi:serine/threonine protein phosphatase PrpC
VQLKATDKFVVAATDGLWDAVSNSKVAEVVGRHWESGDAKGAAEALLQLAVKNAQKHGGYVDDISIVILLRG